MTMNATSQNNANVLHDSLELSGKALEKWLHADSNYPSLLDSLGLNVQSGATVSGLYETAYPVVDSAVSGLVAIQQVSILQRNPLPQELMEQFGHMQVNCLMGLFPEISRAWLTIDSGIYVWAYEDGNDVAYFNGLTETILSVALLKPKPNVFQNFIHHLLCLATPLEIVLLGVTFQNQAGKNSEEMHLLPEPLFVVPTDGVQLCTITGTNTGRIFLGSKDGSLYELIYQSEDGWFTRRCRKVNHSRGLLSFMVPSFVTVALYDEDPIIQIVIDETRNTLYTRSEKGTLQVYDMGVKGDTLVKVTSLTQNALANQASALAKTVDRSVFYPLASICSIQRHECSQLHLCVITHSGTRLYYSTTAVSNNLDRPYTLNLMHVRLPPGFAANSAPSRPIRVHTGYYSKGTLLLASGVTDENDALWLLSSDPFPFHMELREMQSIVPITGRTWALAEVRASSIVRDVTQRSLPACAEPPLVLTQHAELRRVFVALSVQGTVVISKMRPVDQLRQLLLDCNGADADSVRAYFNMHKEEHSCAIALVLACQQSVQDQQVAEYARRAFFLYGGEPRILSSTGHPQTGSPYLQGSASPITSTLQNSFMETPTGGAFSPEVVSTPYQSTTGVNMIQEVTFSGKHNGLYVYFGRLIRPFWYLRLTQSRLLAGTMKVYCLYPCLLSDEVSVFLRHLNSFRDFLERNTQLTSVSAAAHLLNNSAVGSDGSRAPQLEAQLQEKQSILALKQLVNHTCQVLGLWKILVDHQFHYLSQALPIDLQRQLCNMSFRDLVLGGQEMCTALIAQLINRFLNDFAVTDVIIERLREVCPSIYKNEDAVCSKTSEILMNASNLQNQVEKERLLQEALQLAKSIAPKLHLDVICQHFVSNGFYVGVLELCLCSASKKDPQSIATRYYKNGEPVEDQHSANIFMQRMDCYKPVIKMIEDLSRIPDTQQRLNTSVNQGTPEQLPLPIVLAREQVQEVLRQALKSEDELFHVALYDWMLEHQWYDDLLEVHHPFLESYLKKVSSQQANPLSTLDLMWKYYEKNNNYLAAAKILSKLADMHSTQVNLNQRLEYLSRAIMCLKSGEHGIALPAQGELLHELEEKMEVARVQFLILENVLSISKNIRVDEYVSKLNSDLQDVTQLYETYAEHFELWECKLAILHCAGHQDPLLIETVWCNIIDQELQKTIGDNVDRKIEAMRSKVKALGKLYAASHQFFPIEFIVKQLELESCRLGGDRKWVFTTMQEVGIPVTKLINVYNSLSLSNDAAFQNEQQPYHLTWVLAELLQFAANSLHLIPQTERNHFITLCEDIITRHLVSLDCKTNSREISQYLRFVRDEFEGLH